MDGGAVHIALLGKQALLEIHPLTWLSELPPHLLELSHEIFPWRW